MIWSNEICSTLVSVPNSFTFYIVCIVQLGSNLITLLLINMISQLFTFKSNKLDRMSECCSITVFSACIPRAPGVFRHSSDLLIDTHNAGTENLFDLSSHQCHCLPPSESTTRSLEQILQKAMQNRRKGNFLTVTIKCLLFSICYCKTTAFSVSSSHV